MKRLLILAAVAAAWAANAQTAYPGSKSITIVVPFAAGGPTDRVARDLAEAMRKPLGGATLVIENVAGAGGTIGANKVAKAPADGYTLFLHHIGMATAPALYRKLPYSVENDFSYVGMVNELRNAVTELEKLSAKHHKDDEAEMRFLRDGVVPCIARVRAACDALEKVTPSDNWPVPTYAEMLLMK